MTTTSERRAAVGLRFKVGDRVRLRDDHPSHNDEVGAISGVTFSSSRSQIYFVEWDNWNIDMLFWFETELELIAAADAVAAPDVDPDMTITFAAPVVGETVAAPAVGVSPDAQAVIEETIRALEKIYAGQITMNNHSHRPWLLKRIDALRALLTASSEGGRGGEAGEEP